MISNYQLIHPFLDTIPKHLVSELENGNIPSVNHALGIGKLGGEFYGLALCESYGIVDKKIIQEISLLSVYLRAFIVYDDYIKDTQNLRIDLIKNIEIWLKRIESRILKILTKYDGIVKGNILWKEYLEIYNSIYYNFDKSNIYNSIIEKCFLIFLPFEMDLFKNRKSKDDIESFMKNFLFSLQLIDDFHDMKEDLIAPKNQNIHLSITNTENHELLISKRVFILYDLCNYIESNLLQFKTTISNSYILKYLGNSLEWLNLRKEEFTCFKFYEGGFIDIHFNEHNLIEIKKLSNNKHLDINVIRAENMHTI